MPWKTKQKGSLKTEICIFCWQRRSYLKHQKTCTFHPATAYPAAETAERCQAWAASRSHLQWQHHSDRCGCCAVPGPGPASWRNMLCPPQNWDLQHTPHSHPVICLDLKLGPGIKNTAHTTFTGSHRSGSKTGTCSKNTAHTTFTPSHPSGSKTGTRQRKHSTHHIHTEPSTWN